MKKRLGQQETQMLAYLQMRKQRLVRTGDLVGPLRLSRLQERELFRRMARGRLIARVRPGLYLVPDNLPLGGSWTPSPALALAALLDDRSGTYQICGPNAFNRYGFDEQVPTRVYAYNNRISGDRTVGAVALTLIKVADERLGDTEEAPATNGASARYSSRARALVDAVYDWSRFRSLPRGFGWITTELAKGLVSAAELVRLALRYGDVATVRRMGALLQRLEASAAPVRKLERSLPPTTGLIPFNPARPKRGTIDRRWGVVMNDPV
jgi:predicted transcriptional regulator of viral defense system